MKRITQWLGLGMVLLAIAGTVAMGLHFDGAKTASYTVQFDRGTQLPPGADGTIEAVAGRLAENETLEAVITGHSGTIGDPKANQELSRARAVEVRERILDAMRANGDDAADRIDVYGAGGSQPLVQEEDEADRAYQRRLARATVTVSVPLP